MFPIPAAAEPLVEAIRGVFTKPTLQRFIVLMTGLMVAMGRRTVSRALRVMEPMLGKGHWSNYHRLYSQARYSMWQLGLAITRQVVALLPADAAIILIADDTVDGKEGDQVWAKGPHRDARRSTRGHTSMKFGHKWLVMCVLVQLPGIARPWALPILCGLCCSEKVAKKAGHRHKTASRLTRQLLMRMMRWFGDRKFILLGDSGVISHRTSDFAYRHRDRVTVVSRMRSDANLYDPPKHPGRQARGGRRASKGRKQRAPRERITELNVAEDEVAWYGSSRRRVRSVTDTGLWFGKHDRCRIVPIRWVCVLGDKKQGLEDAYFYSSDPTVNAKRIIELYAMRWNIEVTFEESRALLGLETTRHWCRQSVLRVTPILFGLFTVVSLIWRELSRSVDAELLTQTPCYRKQSMSFADALYLVRRELWENSLLRHQFPDGGLNSLPLPLQAMLLSELAAAA